MKIPFFLVTGFLGSGKTTLLKEIISEYSEKKKIAVIQNEFAPASVDGTDLKQTGAGFKILEINKGSVFCVCLLNSFIDSLQKFVLEEKPDMVILEASGLSDPIAIVQMLSNGKLQDILYLSYIWTIVDSLNYFKLNKLQLRFRHQIRVADMLVLNKTDLVEGTNHDEIIVSLKEKNPYAKIVTTSHCKIPLANILDKQFNETIAFQEIKKNEKIESCGKPDVEFSVIRSTKMITKEQLIKFLTEIPKSTYRAKGFIKLRNNKVIALQYSFGKYELKEIENYSGPSEIIALGPEIDNVKLNKQFKKISENRIVFTPNITK